MEGRGQVEEVGVAPGPGGAAVEDDGARVVEEPALRGGPKPLPCVDQGAEQARARYIRDDLGVDRTDPTQDMSEQPDVSKRAVDEVRAEVSPVDLGLLTREYLDMKRTLLSSLRPELGHGRANTALAGLVTALPEHIDDAGRDEVLVSLELLTDGVEETVDLSRPQAPDSGLCAAVGPGMGEILLVRAPGDEWLVVDGCAKSRARCSYAQLSLEHYRARLAVIVMTHPHRDHAYGLADLMEEVTSTRHGRCSGCWPRSSRRAPPRPARRAPTYLREWHRGVGVQCDRVRWAADPSCRWDLSLGNTRRLGPATLTVVSPVGSASQPYERSTALLAEWERVRVVLGADLEPTSSWRDTLGHDPRAATHQGLKVAHHGSIGAQEPTLFTSSPNAARVITPYLRLVLSPEVRRGRGGVALHLGSAPRVHLTALPRPDAQQGGAGPTTLPRSSLEATPEMVMDPPVSAFPDCFVAMEWDAAGTVTLHYAPGAVIVTR